MICYISRPTVDIGVNQNAYAEINLPYLTKHNIELVRRSSDGGAVYSDFGNIGFEDIVVGDMSKFGDPIIAALRDLNIKSTKISGRNDVTIDGKKFSGMAIIKGNNVFASGGSIMFGVNSMAGVKTYHLTDHDWSIIDQQLNNKYQTDAWNFGKNPGFKYYVSKHYPIGTVSFNFNERYGAITAIKIYGDFFTSGDPHIVEQHLLGTKLDKTELIKSLEAANLPANLGKISSGELADLILSE